MEAIERIRKAIRESENDMIYGNMEKTVRTVTSLWFHDKAKLVENRKEIGDDDHLRWTIEVFRIKTENETAYFQTEVEININSGTREAFIVKEVIPKKVTVTQYVDKSSKPDKSENHG